MASTAPVIALVAGEASGDNLGAALIEALRARLPEARFIGVAGPRMRAAGCEPIADAGELALMGLAEIVRHLPRLLRLRRRVTSAIVAARPTVFIGIDAPEFNLGLAARLKTRGIRTVQYVSPQVWAWRQGRVRGIGAACDRILCLLPFEPAFYAAHGVEARFVGHPLADQFPLQPDRAAARAALGLAVDDRVVAVLPGSRDGEVSRLAAPFAGACAWLASHRPELRFVAPMVNAAVRARFEAQWSQTAPGLAVQVTDGRAREAMAAADVVLVASGTATLETLLSKRPMVVAYRLAGLTAFLLRRLGLVKVKYFSQPNLLAGREVVPEFFQEAVTPPALGAALLRWLEDPARVAQAESAFADVHGQLRRGGADLAADAVLELIVPSGAS
ncbi:MAG: lipid-A-disaccharide synthase [Gammaproteobacteria bacterium]